MAPQKPKKPPATEVTSEALEAGEAAHAPNPVELVRLFGLTASPDGGMRVVSFDVPISDVDIVDARLPGLNALERLTTEFRKRYMQLSVRGIR